MASNRNRRILAFIVLAAILLLGVLAYAFWSPSFDFESNFSGFNRFSSSKTSETKEVKEFKSIVEEVFGIELTESTVKGCSEYLYKQGCPILVKSSSLKGAYQVPFNYVILEECIIVGEPLNKEFYSLGINVGDPITEINGTNVKDISYHDINSLLCSEKTSSVDLTIGGSVVSTPISYVNTTSEVVTSLDTVTIKIYDLDLTSVGFVLNQIKDYQNVVLDLSEAVCNDASSITAYASLFIAPKNTELFKDSYGNIYRSNRDSALDINVKVIGNNSSSCISLLTSLLSRVNNAYLSLENYGTIDRVSCYENETIDSYLVTYKKVKYDLLIGVSK